VASAPKLLVVLADQWRGMDQGWRGNNEVRTPYVDRLAAGGIGVHGAYANAPVCGPSRASLLTGLLPRRSGVVANDLPLSPAIPTIGHVLAGQGYRTGWIGKWHLDGLPRDRTVPRERRGGFDYWAGTNCTHDYFDGHYYTGDDPAPVPFTGYEPRVQTDLALEFLAAGDDRPFFLVMSYNPPHDPYEKVPAEYVAPYGALTPRPNASGDTDTLRLYYAGISAVDEQVGRLVEAVPDDTIVVVTSDHGDMLGSHGRRAKQVPFEEAVSVPLVVSWPGRLSPREISDGVIGLADLTPTLLGLVGSPALPATDGVDLSSALADGGPLRDAVPLLNAVSHDAGYLQGVPEWRGVRTSRHTYARYVDGSPWLLFDNDADPWQQRDLSGDDGLRAELDAVLDKLLAEAGDVPAPASEVLRADGLVEPWNARERDQHGAAARVLS
jgi:arylsulfatase A-like enzyme